MKCSFPGCWSISFVIDLFWWLPLFVSWECSQNPSSLLPSFLNYWAVAWAYHWYQFVYSTCILIKHMLHLSFSSVSWSLLPNFAFFQVSLSVLEYFFDFFHWLLLTLISCLSFPLVVSLVLQFIDICHLLFHWVPLFFFHITQFLLNVACSSFQSDCYSSLFPSLDCLW